MRNCFLATLIMSAGCVMYAQDQAPPKGPDPRLATVRKALVVAVDELEADRPVAICFAERLSRITPIESVKAKEDADVILRIKAHITQGDEPTPQPRRPTTSADIVAELPDGTVLWSTKYYRGSTPRPQGMDCLLADDLLNALRLAMKKARDAKK